VTASGGAAPAITSTHIVALYEPETGRIRHLHVVTVLAGAEPPSEEEAVAAARDAAAKRHANHEKLAVATSNDRRHLLPQRVDPASGEFVALEIRRP
jgi:hypothetical protein